MMITMDTHQDSVHRCTHCEEDHLRLLVNVCMSKDCSFSCFMLTFLNPHTLKKRPMETINHIQSNYILSHIKDVGSILVALSAPPLQQYLLTAWLVPDKDRMMASRVIFEYNYIFFFTLLY